MAVTESFKKAAAIYTGTIGDELATEMKAHGYVFPIT